jgi:catechol 2,3-dioxygenase-like lactoylglutathione lyase family enzyme
MSQAYPRVLGHIGLTVDEIDAAYEWYRDVLGFTPVMEPDTVTPDDGHFYNLAADAVGFEFDEMQIAHMATGNHVGFELFEFEPTEGTNDPDPADPGLFHLCVQDPNIEELVEEIVGTGGEQLSDVWTIFPEYPEYKMCYCTDPWGNIVEVHSRGYEHMHANLAEGDPPAR